jgi:predicted RNA binding protein YcfA (HicA-like mRNA interferase family)
MLKLKRISGEKGIKRLEKFGFRIVRQSGSHIILKMNDKNFLFNNIVLNFKVIRYRQIKF